MADDCDTSDVVEIRGEDRSIAQVNAAREKKGLRPVTEAQIEGALGYLAAGHSIRETSEITGLTPKHIERLLRRHPDILEQVRQRFALVMRVNLRAAAEKAAARVLERLADEDAAAKIPVGVLANIISNFSERVSELDEAEKSRAVAPNAAFTSRAQAVFEEMGKLIALRKESDPPIEAEVVSTPEPEKTE